LQKARHCKVYKQRPPAGLAPCQTKKPTHLCRKIRRLSTHQHSGES
jgi:hypothetical protein